MTQQERRHTQSGVGNRAEVESVEVGRAHTGVDLAARLERAGPPNECPTNTTPRATRSPATDERDRVATNLRSATQVVIRRPAAARVAGR